MKFCTQCGHPTTTKIPTGDTKIRQTCTHCGTIHYENPKIICGTLTTWQNKVLLCKRAIEPKIGFWTLPAGYMELEETIQQGAERETQEEAHAQVNIEHLYCMYNVPKIGQVYMIFKAQLIDGIFGAGEETLESALFSEEEIPWDQLAFPSVQQTLRHYFEDQKKQVFPFHLETIF